jgi:hypothetical protein
MQRAIEDLRHMLSQMAAEPAAPLTGDLGETNVAS